MSAALGATGTGTPVDLSAEFNLNGIYTDGKTYSTGGLDGGGYSYSENLLSTSRVLSGELFNLDPPTRSTRLRATARRFLCHRGSFPI